MYITIKVLDNGWVRVEFNDLQSHQDVRAINASYRLSSVVKIWHHKNPEFIEIVTTVGDKFPLTHDGSHGFPVSWVDLNDGNGQVTPTSIEHLHDLVEKI